MNKPIKRLDVLVQMAPEVNIAADIGADHGFLSIKLVKERKAKNVIATDISEPSLGKAKRNVKAAGMEENISFAVGDGLSVVDKCELIVICGMGGELIADILKKDMTKAKQAEYLLLGPHGSCAETENIFKSKRI